MSHTVPEAVRGLLSDGGKLLIVGGYLQSQIKTDDPRIVIWDDVAQGNLETWEVPMNTRAILFNRKVSHTTVSRLQKFAKNRHCTIFPMQTTAEIRVVINKLNEPIVEAPVMEQEEPKLSVQDEVREAFDHVFPEKFQEAIVGTPKQEEPMKRKQMKRGFWKEFLGDYHSPEGSISSEADRLMPILSSKGHKLSKEAIEQSVMAYRKKNKGRMSYTPRKKKEVFPLGFRERIDACITSLQNLKDEIIMLESYKDKYEALKDLLKD